MMVLAVDYAVSPTTVHKHLKELGVETRRRGPKRVRTEDGQFSCRSCHQLKPASEFHRDKAKNIVTCDCKDCARAIYRKRMYDVTQEEYDAMLAAQCGGCAICGCKPDKQTHKAIKQLPVDHCHATGAVRGLVCHSCNNGIGRFFDSPDLLEKAAAYLRRSTP